MITKSLPSISLRSCRQISTNIKLYAEAASASKKDEYYSKIGELKTELAKPEGWDDAFPYEAIPGPKGLPLIGNTWRFLPHIGEFHGLDMLQLHERLYKKYGPILTLGSMFGEKMVFLFEPTASENLFRNEGAWPVRYALPSLVRYRTETRKDVFQDVGGLLSVNGKDWYDIRSRVNPILMQPRNAARYAGVMGEVADELVRKMRYFASLNTEGEMPADFNNELYKWALESVGVISVDKRLGCLKLDLDPDSEPQKIINSVLNMFELSYKLDILPSFGRFIAAGTWREFTKTMDYLTFTIVKYIKEAKDKLENNPDTKSDREKSVLEKLLEVDEKIALTMATDVITAGIDTTGRVMAAALYFLARNPDKQEKLREEIVTLLPSKDTKIDKEILNEAHYLKAVVKETTRISPIAIGLLRSTVKDLVLCGYQIPKGTPVLANNLLLSNNDQFVLKPKKFLPERFLRTTASELSYKNIHPFVFLPFGFGPRSCIGKRLANLELEVGLAKIIRNFELSWPHEDMPFTTRILHGIGGPLKIRIKEINN